MATHTAIIATGQGQPLSTKQIDTPSPSADEVQLHVEWTGSSPLDLHQVDGALLVTYPTLMGGGFVGTVLQAGPAVKRLRTGDKVFGYAFGNDKYKAHQQLASVPEHLLGKLPSNVSPEEAVTVPTNFVTVFNVMYRNLGVELPWPKPASYVPPFAEQPFLIWGGSSSVGQFALQILRYYGYRNLFAAASKKQHALMKELGAAQVFDYREKSVSADILSAAKKIKPEGPSVPFVIDCIGSTDGTLRPINELSEAGTRVAAMLPVIVKTPAVGVVPEYSMDVAGAIPWKSGVQADGVRTHFYAEHPYLREHLQATIMAEMLAQGLVKPNKVRIIEGATMLERAQNALDTLRSADYSGEKLVWRVNDEEAR